MKYTFTTQRELRREFWRTFPELCRRKVKDFSGNGTMYMTDTRCAWVDWLDDLSREGDISEELAQRATL
jgi:hypothetical protein